MSKIPRIVVPGYPHHVVQRGVRSMDIFLCDEDRRAYLGFLRSQGKRYGLTFWCWCLMSNHVHLVVVPSTEDALARGIGEAHRRYTLRFNEREQVKGHLFQERFYSHSVERDQHLLEVVRYVELNPVLAGLAEEAGLYPWSSARHHVTDAPDPLVQDSPVRAMAGDWARFLADGVDRVSEGEAVEKHLRSGRPHGSQAWVRKLEASTGLSLRAPRMGRPRKARGGTAKKS